MSEFPRLADDTPREPVLIISPTENVREFHRKHGFDEGGSINDCTCGATESVARIQLEHASEYLTLMANRWARGTVDAKLFASQKYYDPRLARAHHICEELAELLEAMAKRDEVEALDALTDLDYVVHGTAVAFDLPLDAAHIEVHRSNMTKDFNSARDDRSSHPKGPNFEPPRLKELLEERR